MPFGYKKYRNYFDKILLYSMGKSVILVELTLKRKICAEAVRVKIYMKKWELPVVTSYAS